MSNEKITKIEKTTQAELEKTIKEDKVKNHIYNAIFFSHKKE